MPTLFYELVEWFDAGFSVEMKFDFKLIDNGIYVDAVVHCAMK